MSVSAAIIIPHCDDALRLERCLAALLPQVDADTEVIVIDNASTVPPSAVCAAHRGVRLVNEWRPGAAHARNRGVAETSALLLAFLDCDCIPAPDWLARARTTAGDLVGGHVEIFDETPSPRSGAQAFEAVFAFDNRTYVERKGFSVTANLVTRREVFERTGPFVHGLSEDLDWCRRAVACGFRLVYDDGLRVAHPSRGDWAALARKWRRLTDEGFAVNGRSAGRRAVWAARAMAMPVSIPVHAWHVLRSPRLDGWPDRLGALATLARLRLLRMGWMLRQAICG